MFAPRVAVKSKTVTSGRLAGAVKAEKTRGPLKSRPEAAYSLYSEDAEEQVATLHKGLDRCAALLSDILHCENPGAVPKQDRAMKESGAKCRPHTPTGKKAIRRSVSKSVSNPRSHPMVRRKSSNKHPAVTPQRSIAPPHFGVSLHPPLRKLHLQKTPSKPNSPHIQALCPTRLLTESPTDLDCVPERDLGPGGASVTEGNLTRVRSLLGELRTLMAGHGESVEMYLCLLEQSVSSPLGSEATKNPAEEQYTGQLNALPSHSVHLQREGILKQQIQDKEAAQQILNSQVSSFEEQLCAARKELTQIQNTLRETETKLQGREEENINLKTELESTRGRLRVTLQEKIKMEGMLQQKQHQIDGLHRIIDSHDASTPTPDVQSMCPPGGTKEHVTQYLLSLEQSNPTRSHSPLLQTSVSHQGSEQDVQSVISDWSVQSGTSFNTRDEAEFRDGLAALDASIANLQKTLKMDLVIT